MKLDVFFDDGERFAMGGFRVGWPADPFVDHRQQGGSLVVLGIHLAGFFVKLPGFFEFPFREARPAVKVIRLEKLGVQADGRFEFLRRFVVLLAQRNRQPA